MIFPWTTDREEGRSWPQLLALIIASFGSFSCGMLLAWTSPYIVKITQDKVNYNISEDEASYFTVLPPIMMVISCPIFSKLSDIIGRKKTYHLIAIPQILSWLLKAFTTNVYVFYLARCLYGIADGILFASLPTYIGEICTPRIRGRWGNLLTFSVFLAHFFINSIGIYLTVQLTSCIGIAISLLFLVSFQFMPESPYFCLMQKRELEAKTSLQWLRRKKNVDEEFLRLKKDVDRQMSEPGSWKELLQIESNKKALAAGVFLRVSQQLAGLTVFSVYTKYIFANAAAIISPDSATVLYTGLSFLMNCIAVFTIDYFGRRKSYIGSLSACSVVLCCLAAYFYVEQCLPSVDIQFLTWVPVIGMIVFIIFCAFGVSLIPTLMLGELFSASIKAKGMSVMTIVFGIGQFGTNYLFYLLKSSFGLYSPYLFFAISSLISVWLAFYFVPETSGKTLEEIQQSLKETRKKSDWK